MGKSRVEEATIYPKGSGASNSGGKASEAEDRDPKGDHLEEDHGESS